MSLRAEDSQPTPDETVPGNGVDSSTSMRAFLTGWLMSAVYGRGEEVMKIKKVDNRGTTDTFDVTFESGLVLRVNVRVVN